MKTLIVVFGVAILSVQTADACSRCGIFGRGCKFVKQAVVVKPSYGYQYQQPQNVTNLSIVNAYPPGTAQYGVAQLAQAYQPNPDLSVTLSAKIAEQATSGLTAAIQAQSMAMQSTIELQRLALATEHMRAAMGSGQQQHTTSGSLSLEVRQGTGSVAGGATDGQPTPPGSLLRDKCSQCHGVTLQAPKAGIYYDAGHVLDSSSAVAAMRVVSGLDVPEPMRDIIQSLTQEERCSLLLEIATLSRR